MRKQKRKKGNDYRQQMKMMLAVIRLEVGDCIFIRII